MAKQLGLYGWVLYQTFQHNSMHNSIHNRQAYYASIMLAN